MDGSGTENGARPVSHRHPPEGEALTPLATPLSAEGVLAALERLARRGKLAGFRKIDGTTFGVSAFGTPFDRELVGELVERAERAARGMGESEPAAARGSPHPGPHQLEAGEEGSPPPTPLRGATSPVGDGGGSIIRWRLVWKRKMPAIFAIALVASVWPGLPLTDSLLSTYWGWYEGATGPGGWLRTWMWYLPLTAPFVPLAWLGAFKKSRSGSVGHARETVEKIRGELGARAG